MILFFQFAFSDSVFRFSSFYDPNIKLVHNKKNEFSSSFVHAHDDPRFYFKMQEGDPGLMRILPLKEEYKVKMTPEGGFRIYKKGECLTLVDNTKMVMEKCDQGGSQVFMIMSSDNKTIIKPISNITYTYEETF
ncbi:putative SP-containing protein [Vairimorpha necatrix]|uniref:SP-containing protein n=1 Tax=Vairimorpha necatrix TaxID=6039 RepID=A0AAX4JBQ2_9MICR